MPSKSTFKPHEDFEKSQQVENLTLIRQLTGFLNYVTKTRPDIAYYAVNLSNLTAVAHQTHINTALQCIQYLKNTKNYSLIYKKQRKYIKVYFLKSM